MVSAKMRILIIIFCGIQLQYTSVDATVPLGKPYFDSVPLPPVTPGPINITSADTERVIRLPRITLVTLNRTDTMQNTGTEVFVTPANDSGTATIGGTCGLVKYLLYGVRFVWNSALEAADSIVDGHGTPLEVIVIYINSNYGSFQEAILHRDGLFIVSTRVKVGGQSNSHFTAFIPYLNAIIPEGSSVSVPADILTAWFSKPYRREYFAYAGSYTDFATQQQYYCSTMNVHTLSDAPSISLAQFQASFMLLKNSSNMTYDDPLSSFNSTGTPVIRTGPEFTITTWK